MLTKNKSSKSKKQPTNSKKTNNKTRFQKFIDFVKSHKLLMIVLVILLAVVIWYLTLQVIIIRERNQLNKAETSLEDFTSQLQSVFGYNIDFEQKKSCGYRSTKFVSPGNPSCGISYTGNIPVNSATQATEYAKQITKYLEVRYPVSYEKDVVFEDGRNTLFSEGFVRSFNYSGLGCRMRIEYFDPKDVSTNLEESHEIALSYGCTNPNSHKAFYTVLD